MLYLHSKNIASHTASHKKKILTTSVLSLQTYSSLTQENEWNIILLFNTSSYLLCDIIESLEILMNTICAC
jgi:hypothetical protein